jgi:DNA primase
VLLGALIERPALLHVLAEEVAHLPVANLELERLRACLLDALSLMPSGVDPAADIAFSEGSGETPLEAKLISDHLQRNGLGRLAAMAQGKAREVFRDDKDGDGWVGQWRRTARHLNQHQAEPLELRLAQQAFANEPTEENLQRFQDILDRMRLQAIEAGRNIDG